MMDFSKRVIPNVSANFLYREALARYVFARKFIKRGDKVLDLGCGTGYGGGFLGKKAKVLGVDNEKEAIKFAKKHYGEDAKFLLADATNLSFAKKESFDIVCALELIEHFKNPDQFLNEVKRVLKNKGIFILSTPNADVISPPRGLASPYHVREYKYEGICKLLKQHFGSVALFGQQRSARAKQAIDEFMRSQKAREAIVGKDLLGIRKLLPKAFKERIWQYLGKFWGRDSQEYLGTEDFPIRKVEVKNSYYFVAVCQK